MHFPYFCPQSPYQPVPLRPQSQHQFQQLDDDKNRYFVDYPNAGGSAQRYFEKCYGILLPPL
ncbi:hypothetical protein [Oceanobacillus chungangensis]|uniref:Uncharacterized protein n=1 Tax=Oceanobacillus chungangensis TaxID=1229152 RepID=A0A3D8Q2Y7_9BACI|nr:hypothetical protein [Oceanobacillus chungangensis]RDW22098.1 hypothetical protein CWR45_01010 [Oceanobacillus chungangensis]